MAIILSVSRAAEHWSRVCQATIPDHWEGFCDEINGRIDGETREEVIDAAVSELKARGISGTLKVVAA